MDLNTLLNIDIDSVDKDFLFNSENVIGDNWDVIKEDHISLDFWYGEVPNIKREKVDNVIVEIREKTIQLGPSRDDEELGFQAFTFNIESSNIKAFKMSIFPKYDPDDDENVNIYAKKERVEVGSPMPRTSNHKQDLWKAGIEDYLEATTTQKNKERLETKLNRIQGPMIRSLIDGTWKPHKVVTEPNFSVKVEGGQDMVAFGYFRHAKQSEHQNLTDDSPSFVRSFIPGVYRLSVITLKEDDFEYPIAIFHNEAVSPCKIVQRMLLTKDMPFTRVANSIGRGDWDQCYDEESYEDLLSDDDEEIGGTIECPWGYSLYRESKKWIMYFTPVSNSSFEVGVKKGFHEDSKHIRGAYQIFGPTDIEIESSDNISEYEKVSVGIDMIALDEASEYIYGEVFQDEETDKNFALAIYSTLNSMRYFELEYPECLKKEMFEKGEHNWKFKMKEFFDN